MTTPPWSLRPERPSRPTRSTVTHGAARRRWGRRSPFPLRSLRWTWPRDEIRFGSIGLEVLHTPGHTQGRCASSPAARGRCSRANARRRVGRVDLPGASADPMVESLARLSRIEGQLAVHPGHGCDVHDRARAALAADGRGATRPSGSDAASDDGPRRRRRDRPLRAQQRPKADCGGNGLEVRATRRVERVCSQARREAVERAYRDHVDDVFRVVYAVHADGAGA